MCRETMEETGIPVRPESVTRAASRRERGGGYLSCGIRHRELGFVGSQCNILHPSESFNSDTAPQVTRKKIRLVCREVEVNKKLVKSHTLDPTAVKFQDHRSFHLTSHHIWHLFSTYVFVFIRLWYLD